MGQLPDRGSPDPETAPHPRRWLILYILCLSLTMVVISMSSLNVALPSIQRELNASGSDLQWIVDAYVLVFAGLLLPFGALGDRWGRKRVLMAGMALFGVLSALAAFSTSPGQIILYRAGMGVAAALVMPATLSIATVIFPRSERPKAVAVWAAFAGAGGAIGPPVSGILLNFFWWGSVFLVAVPVAAVVLAGTAWIVPESRDDEQRPLDIAGALLSIAALGSLLFAVIEGPELGWGSPAVLGMFAAACVLVWGFVRWERRILYPMLDPAFFANRLFSLGAASMTLAFFGLVGMFFLLTQYFQFAQGHTPLDAGFRNVPLAVTMMILAPRCPAIAQRVGARATICGGLLLAGAGLGIMAALTPASDYWLMVIALVTTAAGLSLFMPPSTHIIVTSLPKHKAGVGSAVNDTTREVGAAIGIATLGTLLTVGYRSGIRSQVSDLPEAAAEAANDSIGTALRVARDLPAEGAAALTRSAVDAFNRGMTLAMTVAAGLLALTAAATYLLYPREPTPSPPSQQAQTTPQRS
ncbi:MAG: MFS transporter [bacterium]|nr:MFS transporter [bacterium]